MKTIFTLLAAFCAVYGFSQTVYLSAGAGIGLLSNKWDEPLPAFTVGVNIENPIGDNDKGAFIIGLNYRQRGNNSDAARTRLQQIQFDVGGKFKAGKFSVGAGFYYALSTQTKYWVKLGDELAEIDLEGYESGAGVSAFVERVLTERFGLRLVYDHGLGNISPFPSTEVTAQGLYLCAQIKI